MKKWAQDNLVQALVSLLIALLLGVIFLLPSLRVWVWDKPSKLMVITWAQQGAGATPLPESAGANASNGEEPTGGVTGSNTDNTWSLKGLVVPNPEERIRNDLQAIDSAGTRGARIKDISVFAVSTDRSGNRFSPLPTMTNDNGSFTFDQPITLDPKISNNTAEVKIYAQSGERSGKDTITIGQIGSNRTIPISGLTILPLPVIFIISIIVALIQVSKCSSLRWQYYGSILLALLFSFTMLGYIMVGLAQIDEEGSRGEIFTIAFLKIFHGSYANGGAQSWIVSLTSDVVSPDAVLPDIVSPDAVLPDVVSPDAVLPDAVSPDAIPSGLGAPSWVILMSVIGSTSYTIVLLLQQIPSEVPFNKPIKIRKMVHQLAVHQFYVLVAPLGAVLVYQTLVIAEAASQEVAVATVALASGIGLSLLLEKARPLVEKLLRNETL